MSEAKHYSLLELSEIVNFNKNYVKVVLQKMDVNPDFPIAEEDAKAVAERLSRPWPSSS